MAPHYLRFVRALAFVGVAGCGARVELPPLTDSGSGDTSPDADAAWQPGRCTDWSGRGMPCAPGNTCEWSDVNALVCRDGAPGSACGTISCGVGCICVTDEVSTCKCTGAIEGPLPPPDLSVA